MLERIFRLSENNTNVRTELLAGITTFLTMAYIIFVNPAVLSKDFSGNPTGLDFGAVLLATCLASAAASILMGLYARYPIALAPGMGENFFFVSVIMGLQTLGMAEAWRVALGIVFVSGVIFIFVSLFGAREALVYSLSPSLRSAIAVGIGLLIAFIGLKNAGILIAKPGIGIGLNPHLYSAQVGIFCFALLLTVFLEIRRVPGALILGILGGAIFALLLGQIQWTGKIFGLPEIHQSAIFALDIRRALSPTAFPFVLVFFFMVLFDTTGTLVAVAQHGGFMKGRELPRAKEVFLVDALATAGGACLGTSTVTSFIESIAGVEQGGKTGLTSVTTGVLFLAAVFFSPLIGLVGQHAAITAPALLLVGVLMAQNVRSIDWNDLSEALPSFLIMLGIPLTYSIADGVALGLISYPVVKILSGKTKEIPWLLYPVALLLLAYFIFIRSKI
ncbi:MAG: NCS2 family permease [Candidatus Omnitrophica bacterium]|nr:NCS2 family permease [Candidatus Omnitrophota bacterium]